MNRFELVLPAGILVSGLGMAASGRLLPRALIEPGMLVSCAAGVALVVWVLSFLHPSRRFQFILVGALTLAIQVFIFWPLDDPACSAILGCRGVGR